VTLENRTEVPIECRRIITELALFRRQVIGANYLVGQMLDDARKRHLDEIEAPLEAAGLLVDRTDPLFRDHPQGRWA
jgi:hypothetical protein